MNPLEQRMAELAARFAARAGENRQALAAAVAADDRAALADIAHRLAGTAGMFGFHALSEQAATLEQLVEGGLDYQAEADRLGRLLTELGAAG